MDELKKKKIKPLKLLLYFLFLNIQNATTIYLKLGFFGNYQLFFQKC